MYNLQLLKNKPHKVVWSFILVVLAIVIVKRVVMVDVQMYHAYIAFPVVDLGGMICAFLGLFGMIYWLFRNKKLVDWMTIFHVIISFIVILILMIFFTERENNTEFDRMVDQYFQTIISLLGLTQILFLINIFLSLGRDIEKQEPSKT